MWLNGRPFRARLEARLGAPGAHRQRRQLLRAVGGGRRRGPGAPVVFGVILGTGVGAGIVVGGRVLDGRNAIAGEWGHNPLPWPAGRRASGRRVLLRARRLHRDLAVRPGLRARPPPAHRGGPPGTGDRRRGRRRRCGRRRVARALRGAARARARARGQPARPGRDRAGRRHVQRRAALRTRPATVGRVDLLRSRRHACSRATCTAIRAACAARRGCGRRPGDPLHRRVVRAAAAFGRHPVDVLPRILDVAGLAVHAVLRR